MNKKEFLNELEKKLELLNNEEKQDILNEYEDIINEHIKDGASEVEAVESFGDIDNLTKEILSIYKINPEYMNKKTPSEKAKQVFENTDAVIKEGAKRTSTFFEKIGEGIADFLTSIGSAFVKKRDNELTEEELEKRKADKKVRDEKLSKAVVIVLKVIFFLIFMFPILMIILSLVMGTSVIIYLIIKGIALYGMLILFLGLVLGFTGFYLMLRSIIKGKFKAYLYIYLIAFGFSILGGIMSVDYFSKIEYIDSIKEGRFETNVIEDMFTTDKEVNIYTSLLRNVEYEVDDSLEDNQYKYTITYYDAFITPDIYTSKYSDAYNINIHNGDRFNTNGFYFDYIVDDLKEYKIYSVEEYFEINIKIIANSKTMNNINERV